MKLSPEPERQLEREDLILDGASLVIMDESSDDEEQLAFFDNHFTTNGYELLPQEVPSSDTQHDDLETSNSTNDVAGPSQPRVPSQAETNDVRDVLPPTSDCSNRRDADRLEINADEVRAAMRNVTLPPSSFPPWTASIPESEWTGYLMSRTTGSTVCCNPPP